MSKKVGTTTLAICVLVLCTTSAAIAASNGAPWDAPIDTFVGWMTGKLALGLSVVALVIAGAKALFSGGELSGYAKTFILVVIGAATITGAVAVFNLLFAGAGAIIS